MSSNDRPTDKELAQTFFTDLIRDAGAQPDPALNPEMARLIRELVLTEQATDRSARPDFAAARQRIRRKVRPPAGAGSQTVETGPSRWTGPILYQTGPTHIRQGGVLAWNKFLALAGMAATIVLVVGILILSLAAVRPPEATPAIGASPGVSPASIPTVAVRPTPSPTVQPTLNSKTADGLLNPKMYLEQALVDVAKSLSLDLNTLQKQLDSGMSLAEIAKMQGVDLASLKAIMLDSFKAQITAEKDSGQLTQTQADDLLKASSAFIDSYVMSQSAPFVAKPTPNP